MSAWLIDVLDAALPELTGKRRDELAAAILEAVPGRMVAESIAHSTAAVLNQRGIPDIDGLSRELGNNAALTVILMLRASVAFDDFADETTPIAELEVTHGAL